MAQRIIRRPSKDMQKFLKAGANGRLLGPLERFLQNEEPEFRRQDILHPSSMAKPNWCPKAGYQQLQWDAAGKAPAPEKHSLVKQNIFDEGHFIHDKWQQRLWRQGVLYGKWECISCVDKDGVSPFTWWATAPSVCYNGHPRKFLRYREITLEAPEYRIGGHSDGWVKDGQPDTLIEIKSVGLGSYRFDAQNLVERYGEDANELWKNTKRPFTSHINQGQIYLHLCHLMFGDAAPKDIVFIYEFKVNQQVKEFVVPYQPDLTKGIFRDAADIVSRLEKGQGPPDCVTGHSCEECKRYSE